jgi:hypothetical protein
MYRKDNFLLTISHVIPSASSFPSMVTLLVTGGSHVDMSRHPLFLLTITCLWSKSRLPAVDSDESTGEITEASTQPHNRWLLVPSGHCTATIGFFLCLSVGWLLQQAHRLSRELPHKQNRALTANSLRATVTTLRQWSDLTLFKPACPNG